MGFINRDANIQGKFYSKNLTNKDTPNSKNGFYLKALTATMGDVNAAIDRLLNQQSQL
jgi:hypothetical protein